jgi:hypothetical protein
MDLKACEKYFPFGGTVLNSTQMASRDQKSCQIRKIRRKVGCVLAPLAGMSYVKNKKYKKYNNKRQTKQTIPMRLASSEERRAGKPESNLCLTLKADNIERERERESIRQHGQSYDNPQLEMPKYRKKKFCL